jgi:thiol-disulfide isomerase/thioredoxin
VVRIWHVVPIVLLFVAVAIALERGDQAPSFALRTLSGDYFFLRDICGSDLRQPNVEPKTVVLDFWALWCKPCHRKLPLIREVVSGFDSSCVSLVIISEDSLTVRDQIEPVLAPFAPHEVCVLDPYHIVMEKFDVESIPTTFVVSPNGEVTAVFGTNTGDDSLASKVREAIERAQEP